MVFSSLPFLLVFLPLVALTYQGLLRNRRGRLALGFLFLASLFYYAYWKPENLWIILASIGINYLFGQLLSPAVRWRFPLFLAGLGVNLGGLAYFKYTDFFLASINTLGHTAFPLTGIVLPIGISFFTFQQIAYLSDIYTKKHDPTDEGLLDYCLFVCFFPQLVAGPIVHHQEMMPQFARALTTPVSREKVWEECYQGLFILGLGLAKKVLLADNLSPVARYCFDVAPSLTLAEALAGSFAYTLQLYFDFSGYSDMAIGCALFFGIRLPQNFLSPYKAVSIQDFWRRWHITLSRWLRDYLYIPMGGSRCGTLRTLRNLFLTFLLGGLWHGAAWTFVLWGALHGAALAAHRVWSRVWMRRMPRLGGWLLTFCFVDLAWVVFRAPDFACVRKFGAALAGRTGWGVGPAFREAMSAAYRSFGTVPLWGVGLFGLACLALALFAKNSTELSADAVPTRARTAACMALFGLSLALLLLPEKTSEFIYFQF